MPICEPCRQPHTPDQCQGVTAGCYCQHRTRTTTEPGGRLTGPGAGWANMHRNLAGDAAVRAAENAALSGRFDSTDKNGET